MSGVETVGDLEDALELDSWPPRDPAGNEYDTDWFEVSNADSNGYLTDSNGRDYSPFQGSLEPIEGRCNAPLTAWRDRYPSRRYCGRIIPYGSDWTFCSTHRSRESMKSAEDLVKSGAFAQSFDTLYEGLDPYKKLMAHGMWSQLMGESTKQFDTKTVEKTFDFSSTELPPPTETDEEDSLTVTVEYPRSHGQAGLFLWCAALDTVKMISIQSQIMDESGDSGVMENTETSQAQLTSPTEEDPTQNFKTIEELSEHHLNLPYSRLITDQPKLLERGGVVVDDDEGASTGDVDNMILQVEADPEVTDSAPNTIEGDAESEVIVDAVEDGSVDGLDGVDDLSDST